MKKVIITTGGTGGHIYPALSVANELIEDGIEVIFVGSNSRMEKDMVSKSGVKFIGLDIQVPRKLKNIIKYFKSIVAAFKLIKSEKPDVVIGFGNYISIPIVFGAILLRKKVFLQEQNVNVGLANRLFYNRAVKTFLAFEKTYDEMPIKYQHKFKVTGNPLRKEIYDIKYPTEREKLNIKENEKVLLITGGSLGAKEINDEIINQWDKFLEDKNLRIFWATGVNNYEDVISKIKRTKPNDYIKPYFDNMINIMGASDLLICRAGALTISEIIELGKPSIIVPYSSAKVGQYENAKILSDIDAAIVYDRTQIKEAIKTCLDLIKNDEELKRMRIRVKSLKKTNAAKSIVRSIKNTED